LAEFDREIKKPGGQRVEANGAPAGKIRSDRFSIRIAMPIGSVMARGGYADAMGLSRLSTTESLVVPPQIACTSAVS
jgi:hypothetical protein